MEVKQGNVRARADMVPTRKAANRASRVTRSAIIAAAERLFATHGIDNVSLREIAFSSGLKNTNAVNYHFGGKEGLIHAISHRYTLEFEDIRAGMMDAAQSGGRLYDIQTLLEILTLPYLSVVNDDGSHRYAKFLSQVTLRSVDGRMFYPFLNDEANPAPVCRALLQHLRERMPHLPEDIFRLRIRGIIRIFVGAVVGWDSADTGGADTPALERILVDAISQMTAAFSAPFFYENGRSLFMRPDGEHSEAFSRQG